MNKKFKGFMNILIYLLIFITSQFFASAIVIVIFGVMNIHELASITDINHIEQEMYGFIGKYTPIIYIVSFFISIIAYYIIFKSRKKNIVKAAGFSKIPIYKAFILVFIGVTTNIILEFALKYISYYFDLENMFLEYNNFIERMFSSGNMILLLLSIGILYPILEEVVFRGFIFNRLRKNTSLTKAIGIQAFLFGLLHFNAIQGSYAFLLGLLLAYICIWTGSIWAPIIIHVSLNSYSVVGTKFPQLLEGNILYASVSILVLVIGTLIIYKTRVKDTKLE